MWFRNWFKSHTKVHSAPVSPPPCSNFQDVPTLLANQKSESKHSRKPSIFQQIRHSTEALCNKWAHRHCTTELVPPAPASITIPDGKGLVVVYFTSLRVVRRTFEDGRAVRSILSGFPVAIDERDVSMDAGILEDLHAIKGLKNVSLPVVFIDGKYVGGAEEVKLMFETGELDTLLKKLPVGRSRVCDLCGGYRYLVCDLCNGSRKIYSHEFGFVNCMYCNPNGLIACPCSPRLSRTVSV